MSLGKNIRNRRQALKLSQEYVAAHLGVSRQAVSKWETGQSEPSTGNLIELAALFEVSLSELVEADAAAENKMPSPPSDEIKRQQTLRTNLSMLAISFQAGLLHSCTQVMYIEVDGQRVPDHRFMLFKVALLFLCSVWMASNLRYEKDFAQRKKNSRIELAYCCVQLMIALLTYRFTMGLVGLVLHACVLLFYILYINPRYMNRPFGKKESL